MAIAPFNRRALLQTGAAAAGTLAVLGGAVPGTAKPIPGSARHLSGTLLAWVILHPEAGAEIRLVHLDDTGQVLGQSAPIALAAAELGGEGARVSAWGQMHAACARAQDLAVGIAARAWAVPATSCAVLPGRIAHAASGRAIGYKAWVDTV